MLESAYENKVFVNFIDESLAIMLILARNYNGFLVDMFCLDFNIPASPSIRHPPRMIQIGIRCSGTKKCSQRHRIDHFCQGFFSAIQPSEIPLGIPLEPFAKGDLYHVEPSLEIPLGIPVEPSLEIPLEISFEIPLEIPVGIPFEIPIEIPREIPLEIRLEIHQI